MHADRARNDVDQRHAALKALPPALQPLEQLLCPALRGGGVGVGGGGWCVCGVGGGGGGSSSAGSKRDSAGERGMSLQS